MKSKISHIARVMLALVLYVFCSSVVCCEACKHSVSATSLQDGSTSNLQQENIRQQYNKQSVDEDVSPLSLGSIRLSELL